MSQCGADIATNLDLAHGFNQKIVELGTDSFRTFVECRHRQGRKKGTHRRSVYRLGIGSEDQFAGYSNAFSIVTQPDGTFFWLQSFIGHYSLSTWMKKVDGTNESGLAGHLTLDELLRKLDIVDRLMNINDWTDEANQDYFDLFNVDMDVEAVKNSPTRKRTRWNDTHRLDFFEWDEACEYPLPKGNEQVGGEETNDMCSSLLMGNFVSSW